MNTLRTISLLSLVLVASAAAAEPAAAECPEPGRVSISAHELPIRMFLRELAETSKLNIAVDPGLRGRVSLEVTCVDPRTALKLALGQIGAAFCESRNVLYVARPGRSTCSNPQPVVERVGRRVR